MKNYLYFAEATVRTGAATTDPESVLVPASNYLGSKSTGTTTTEFYFKPVRSGGQSEKLVIAVTHATTANGGGYKNMVRAMTTCFNARPHSAGHVTAIDMESGTAKDTEVNISFDGMGITTVAISHADARPDIAVSGVHYGAGALSTAGAPQVFRSVQGNVIYTQIKVHMDGLEVKGDAATDAIGLDGVTGAYIYKNIVADNGILFDWAVTCLVLPTQQGATITTDIDFDWHASGTIAYDGDVDSAATVKMNTATLVAGEKKIGAQSDIIPADNYLYMVEGDTTASTGEYADGVFLIEIWGCKDHTATN